MSSQDHKNMFRFQRRQTLWLILMSRNWITVENVTPKKRAIATNINLNGPYPCQTVWLLAHGGSHVKDDHIDLKPKKHLKLCGNRGWYKKKICNNLSRETKLNSIWEDLDIWIFFPEHLFCCLQLHLQRNSKVSYQLWTMFISFEQCSLNIQLCEAAASFCWEIVQMWWCDGQSNQVEV